MVHRLWRDGGRLLVHTDLLRRLLLLLLHLPLRLRRSVSSRNVQPGEVLMKSSIGRPSRAGRPRARGHHRGTCWLTRVWRRRVIETLNARQSRHLAGGGLAREGWSMVVRGLMIGKTARGRALSVVAVRAGMPGSAAVVELGLGVTPSMGEDRAGRAAKHTSALGEVDRGPRWQRAEIHRLRIRAAILVLVLQLSRWNG